MAEIVASAQKLPEDSMFRFALINAVVMEMEQQKINHGGEGLTDNERKMIYLLLDDPNIGRAWMSLVS
jgi:hypothetical protein